ncbi:MAG: AarF/UbiB family protein [Archangium sp.]|nr:AarF/UbiB family protein [Archangium sp.]MDP3155607.1 AarF/UbiB family protein [Archangium sp.]MDP3570787.1 AarF/UbiB family protein [Archangium sp.]
MIREAFQDLKRLRQISLIAGRFGFADLLERTGIRKKDESKPETAESARAATAARRFCLMLAELGPTFVKLGQVMSTRGDLLPREFIEELETLQDDVPPVPFDQVRTVIKEAFGKELEEVFAEFSPEPIAAASMAQAHQAKTKEGERVIVKVQRPGITEQLRADLSVLHYIARALEAVIEEVGVYTPTGIIEEFDKAVHEELDFLNEAANIRAFYKNHLEITHTRIPKVYDELTARTVLTMEFFDAPNLTHANLDEEGKKTIAKTILEGAFKQLFEDGLFHGDPHPGNLLVLEGPVLGLIDFGLVGRITRQMQDTLVQLVLAVGLKDSESVARLLYRLGTPDTRTNMIAFRGDIEAILTTYMPTSLKDVNSRHLLADILNLAVKYKIRIPREYAILSRASVAIEGVLRSLYPDLPINEIFLPYAKKLLAERYDPNQLQGGVLKTLLRLQGAANDLPMQLQQIMLDLESGKFTVTVKSEQMSELNQTLRSFAVVAFAGLCACGFIIGTFIAFAGKPFEIWGVPVLGIFGIAATVFLFSTAVVRQSWTGFRKLSIKRFIGKK